jgi:inorganic phosphate transporter, PiT family
MRYPNTTVTLLSSTVLVEIATIFHIPLSNTQTLTAAVFGAGISYKTKLMSSKPFLKIVAGWIIAPLLSLVIGIIIR